MEQPPGRRQAGKQAIFELPFASVSKQVQVRNHSNENEFDLHENELVNERFITRTCFETGKRNSEMAYLFALMPNI